MDGELPLDERHATVEQMEAWKRGTCCHRINLAHMWSRATLFLVITSGCVPIDLNGAESPDETSIREILRAETEAWDRGDGIAWAKDFTEDADLVDLRGDVLH